METDELLDTLRALCEDCPDGFLRIVRMGRSGQPHHRPPWHAPGWAHLPNPQNDTPRYNMRDHEHCAALVEQFRGWWPRPNALVQGDWGNEPMRVTYNDEFVVYVLQVPAYAVVVQQMQVVYNPANAVVVGQFQPH